MRAIGVSHTACKDEFRRNLRSHSWSAFSFFIIMVQVVGAGIFTLGGEFGARYWLGIRRGLDFFFLGGGIFFFLVFP